MESTAEAILSILTELYEKHDEISACMVAKKGLEGVIMFPESFKEEVSYIWSPLEGVINDVLSMISVYSFYELDKTYVELLGYIIPFFVLSKSDTALIVFIPQKNKEDAIEKLGKLWADILKSREKIIALEEH